MNRVPTRSDFPFIGLKIPHTIFCGNQSHKNKSTICPIEKDSNLNFESDSSEQVIQYQERLILSNLFANEYIYRGHNNSISTNELLTSSCYISTMVNQGSTDSFRIESHWYQSLNFWFWWYILKYFKVSSGWSFSYMVVLVLPVVVAVAFLFVFGYVALLFWSAPFVVL